MNARTSGRSVLKTMGSSDVQLLKECPDKEQEYLVEALHSGKFICVVILLTYKLFFVEIVN